MVLPFGSTFHGRAILVGATIFPRDIGQGAARDPGLVRRAQQITRETRATTPQRVFAPCVCVARDDRWGRTYESFGPILHGQAILFGAAIFPHNQRLGRRHPARCR